MKEKVFQSKLIKELKSRFPNCIVEKQDANYIQGIPDLLILYKDKWAMLECKENRNSARRPNQEWFVERCNNMAFAKFIFPENSEEVLNDLEKYFEP